MQKKMVAIIIPLYKEELTAEEDISMKHLQHFLGKYDKHLIAPDNLNIKSIKMILSLRDSTENISVVNKSITN